jgi:hypothetical protein
VKETNPCLQRASILQICVKYQKKNCELKDQRYLRLWKLTNTERSHNRIKRIEFDHIEHIVGEVLRIQQRNSLGDLLQRNALDTWNSKESRGKVRVKWRWL